MRRTYVLITPHHLYIYVIVLFKLARQALLLSDLSIRSAKNVSRKGVPKLPRGKSQADSQRGSNKA